jgi:CelD/BcsL family acetyltransferase involved in cellulose biosynthesis
VPVQPRRFFRCIGQRLLEAERGFVLLAMQDGQCLAGAVCLHWGQVLTCKYSASRPDSLSVRPNNLIFWAAMQWGCEHGFTCFDMGRTEVDNEGLRRYKRGWGAAETPLVYSVIGGESGRAGRPPSGRPADLMHTVIQRSPPWVCRAAGELLYGRMA